MNILITGAAGVLGRAVTALLEREAGVRVRLTDMIDLPTPHEFHRADLSVPEQLTDLCAGIDVLMHIAAIHPWKQYTPQQYLRCNVEGAYHVFRAAADAGVRRVIYTSSIAAMGMGAGSAVRPPWDESKPPEVTDIYSYTKLAGEEACRLFSRQGKFSHLFLRPGTFVPVDPSEPGFGLGLLGAWVHVTDVAMAHLLALRGGLSNEAFVITSRTRFTAEDGPALLTDAASVILRRYPEARRLVDEGVKLPERIHCTYDVSKARRLLGYEPAWTFESWLQRRYAHGS